MQRGDEPRSNERSFGIKLIPSCTSRQGCRESTSDTLPTPVDESKRQRYFSTRSRRRRPTSLRNDRFDVRDWRIKSGVSKADDDIDVGQHIVESFQHRSVRSGDSDDFLDEILLLLLVRDGELLVVDVDRLQFRGREGDSVRFVRQLDVFVFLLDRFRFLLTTTRQHPFPRMM